MNDPKAPRNVDITRAYVRLNAQQKKLNMSSAHPASPAQLPDTAKTVPAQKEANAPVKKKKRALRYALRALAALLVVLLVSCGFLYYYLDNVMLNTGQAGELQKTEEPATPPEFKGDLVNILVLGIDYDSEDPLHDYTDGKGNTDMIMLVQLNQKEKTVNMFQVPRDLYVGQNVPTGGMGKINAVYACGAEQKNLIQNIQSVFRAQFKLDIDHYLTIDMQSLRQIVDNFGGLWVYVPKLMSYGGSLLEPGYRVLQGEEVEFFVRNRKGVGFARSDMDRLENQRYFYSALLKRIRTMSWQDIVAQMPVITSYVNTDLSVTECAALAITAMSIPDENILMCRMPAYDATELYNKNSLLVADVEGTAELLNTYFRTTEGEVPASELGLATDWPHASTPYEALITRMGGSEDSIAANEANDDFTPDDFGQL